MTVRKMLQLGLVAGLVVALVGCASTGNNENTKKGATVGALLGAAAGAVIGYQGDHSGGALRGALAGAAVGGAVGAGVGAYQDKQQAELERRLAEERARNQVEIERMQNEVLKVTLDSSVSFDFDSAAIKPAFEPTLNKVADVLARYDRTEIVVVGHTDSIGSESYNQRLSEDRAVSVASYLTARGVAGRRMQTRGQGEMSPRASNDTPQGQAANRRVELYVVPHNDIQ